MSINKSSHIKCVVIVWLIWLVCFLIRMKEDFINDMTQDGRNDLGDDERGNGYIHRRLIDTDRPHHMETIIIRLLQVNVVLPRERHGKFQMCWCILLFCLDFKILKSNSIDRKKNLLRLVKIDIHPVFIIIIIIIFKFVRDPVCPDFGFREDDRAFGETIFQRQLVFRINMDHHSIVGELRNRRMPEGPFTIELGKGLGPIDPQKKEECTEMPHLHTTTKNNNNLLLVFGYLLQHVYGLFDFSFDINVLSSNLFSWHYF